ncbi:MAG TPA: hypothetical protein VGE62_03670 [Candidatus Paceibacterota bacterium]
MNTNPQNLLQAATKVALLLVIFGFFPVFLAVVVYNYNNNASSLVQITSALDEEYSKASSSLVVLTQEQADILRRINQFSVGVWVDKSDQKARTIINPDNTFSEYEDKSKTAYGTWRAKVVSDRNEAGETQARYMLQKNHLGGNKKVSVLYEIIQLDEETFVLNTIARGSTEDLNRAFDSATGTDTIYRLRSGGGQGTVTLEKDKEPFDQRQE